MQAITGDWEAVKAELSDTAQLREDKFGRPRIVDARRFGSLDDPQVRAQAFSWLRISLNTFVNVIRPRVRSEVANYDNLTR
jgi:hypothetical protein